MRLIQFKPTSSDSPGSLPPISIKLGMEKDHEFSEGNQEEGEKLTAKYISDTYTFYAIKEQLKQTPEEEEQKRKKLKVIQEKI